MIIPKKERTKWKELYEVGDFTLMADRSYRIVKKKIKYSDFSQALKTGRCSDNAYKVLKTFFTEKESAIYA